MMRADNLKVTFNPGTAIENPAMRGMSLHIRDGEFVTVIAATARANPPSSTPSAAT